MFAKPQNIINFCLAILILGERGNFKAAELLFIPFYEPVNFPRFFLNVLTFSVWV